LITTPVCDLLGIRHPVVLGGMAGASATPLVAAVSNAGALGVLGVARLQPEEIAQGIAAVRRATREPFGLNLVLFSASTAAVDTVLDARPPVFSAAWASPEQDLAALFGRAHEAGSRVLYMASTVTEASRATKAGADVIVAQGTEGGGHVGFMASMVLVPMIVDAVGPTPVLAAGGVADGRGLAAALALGAQGVLLGTRFLATRESPLPASFKQAVLESDGHDTWLTEIPDIARGEVWPGAMARCRRNAFVERWAGREWELRARRSEVSAAVARARAAGDAEEAPLLIGQDAGLIHDLPPAAEVVERIVADAAAILGSSLPGLLRRGPPSGPSSR
jgi:NAD(P)H-dependent flavin oxidoreductase YrpB (nitropropane dioxygenase family)